jgi:broad specificity phosphatase PhoE
MIPLQLSQSKAVHETRVLLLRHGETAAPAQFHGSESDVGLGARGHLQAQAAAETLARLGPQALYSSAMRRAVETVAPIAQACGLEPRTIAALHERSMGPLSGAPIDAGLHAYVEAQRHWMAGNLDHTHPGGESYAEIARRVVPPFLEIAQNHQGQTTVVVAHGVVIRVLLTRLVQGYGPEHFTHFAIENCLIYDLRWDGETWSIASPCVGQNEPQHYPTPHVESSKLNDRGDAGTGGLA